MSSRWPWFAPKREPDPPAPVLDRRDIDVRAVLLVSAGQLDVVILWFCPCGRAVLWDGPSVTEIPDALTCPVCLETREPRLDDIYVTFTRPETSPCPTVPTSSSSTTGSTS